MSKKIYGYEVDKFSPDEICEKIGMAKFKKDQLLESFLESRNIMEYALRNESNRELEEAYLNMAPTAYEVYKRFYRDAKDKLNMNHPSLRKEAEESPETILFWSNPVRIDIMYRQMLRDGHYQPNLCLN